MVKMSDLVIDTAKTVGKESPKVTDVKPKYEYRDKVRTSNILGYNYETMFPGMRMEKLNVAIEGPALLEAPNGYYDVQFDGLEIYIYWAGGENHIGARAKGVKVLKDNT